MWHFVACGEIVPIPMSPTTTNEALGALAADHVVCQRQLMSDVVLVDQRMCDDTWRRDPSTDFGPSGTIAS